MRAGTVIVVIMMIVFGTTIFMMNQDKKREVQKPLDVPLQVSVDMDNGFICYFNSQAVSCHALFDAIPDPSVRAYLESVIGHVYPQSKDGQ